MLRNGKTNSAPIGRPSARGMRIALLYAAYNQEIVAGLLSGARAALAELGLADHGVSMVRLPGSFELPLAAQVAAQSGRFDAIVALGAVIRGQTDHYEHIAREAAAGLAAVARATGVPVSFGVLTARHTAHARARSLPGPHNKGAEAARAAVEAVWALRQLRGRRRPAARSPMVARRVARGRSRG
jgi:6,7-dimethyl-8-ribityllumazine synthase